MQEVNSLCTDSGPLWASTLLRNSTQYSLLVASRKVCDCWHDHSSSLASWRTERKAHILAIVETSLCHWIMRSWRAVGLWVCTVTIHLAWLT